VTISAAYTQFAVIIMIDLDHRTTPCLTLNIHFMTTSTDIALHLFGDVAVFIDDLRIVPGKMIVNLTQRLGVLHDESDYSTDRHVAGKALDVTMFRLFPFSILRSHLMTEYTGSRTPKVDSATDHHQTKYRADRDDDTDEK